jgi:hypothetical protein
MSPLLKVSRRFQLRWRFLAQNSTEWCPYVNPVHIYKLFGSSENNSNAARSLFKTFRNSYRGLWMSPLSLFAG